MGLAGKRPTLPPIGCGAEAALFVLSGAARPLQECKGRWAWQRGDETKARYQMLLYVTEALGSGDACDAQHALCEWHQSL